MSDRYDVHAYLSGPESVTRRELVWGMVREPAAPLWPHQQVVTRATVLLYEHVESRALGKVTGSPIDVVLDESQALVVQPDVVFVSNERLRLVNGQIWGAPDIVVEVESPGTRRRDRIDKRDWYARYGVGEYWLIDGTAQTLTVFVFENGNPMRETYRGDMHVRSKVLPDFSRTAADFFHI